MYICVYICTNICKHIYVCVYILHIWIYMCVCINIFYLSIDEYVYIYSGGLHHKFKSFLGQHWSSFFHSKVRSLAEVCAQQVR